MKQAIPLLLTLLITGLALDGSRIHAQDVEAVAASAKADLAAALDELAAARKQIEEERIPLARQLNQLEEEVIQSRRELERAQRSQENQLVELNALKAEVKRRTDEAKYIEALTGEYIRAFETRIHISEVQQFQSSIKDAQLASSPELAVDERFQKLIGFLHTSLQRVENVAGGQRFSGQALVPSGRLEQGQFALLGPMALFASDQSDAAGLVELQLGSPEPSVIELPAEFASGIRDVAASGKGEAPVDPTLGNALKLSSTQDTLAQHILKGGPVMVPILLLGLMALSITLAKWLQISKVRIVTPQDMSVILLNLSRGEFEKAKSHAKSIPGPAGEMLGSALQHAGEPKEFLEEVMYEKMLAAKPRLERWLPFVALSAAAAPLLGLLGTVTGMINTFNMITVYGTGDPKTLAGGISEALITTEYGLIVAIPSLLLHSFLSRKVRGVLGSMEQTAVGLINGVPDSKEEMNEKEGKNEYASNLS